MERNSLSSHQADISPVIDLLVIQPTPFCNLDCDYCYLPNRGDRRKIDPDTLRRIFKAVFESEFLGRQLGIVWHAGEPTTMPIEFYRTAFALAEQSKPEDLALTHSIQTNAVLIDQAWCDFVLETGLQVGVSVDGPAFLHDRHRKTRSGAGTHARTLRGIRRLQDNGIDFHAICVLTRDSLDYPDEIFDFFADNNIGQIGFNIDEIEGANHDSTLTGVGTDTLFRRFLRRFLDLLKQHPGILSVREFDDTMSAIAADENAAIYNHQVMPFGIVSVDADGNISTFSPELLGQSSRTYGDFAFGNVHQGGLDDVENNAAFQKTRREIKAGLSRCRETCDYYGVCGGGAPSNKFFEHGRFDETETMYCRLTKMAVTDIVISDIEADLAQHAAEFVTAAGGQRA